MKVIRHCRLAAEKLLYLEYMLVLIDIYRILWRFERHICRDVRCVQ